MKPEKSGVLYWDSGTGRISLNGYGMHCGQVFQLWSDQDGQWHQVRIEHSDRWYLVSSCDEFSGLTTDEILGRIAKQV